MTASSVPSRIRQSLRAIVVPQIREFLPSPIRSALGFRLFRSPQDDPAMPGLSVFEDEVRKVFALKCRSIDEIRWWR